MSATIDGVLPPAAVRRQLNESAWHLGFATESHDLPRHLPDARAHSCLLSTTDSSYSGTFRALFLRGPLAKLLLWLDLSSARLRSARVYGLMPLSLGSKFKDNERTEYTTTVDHSGIRGLGTAVLDSSGAASHLSAGVQLV